GRVEQRCGRWTRSAFRRSGDDRAQVRDLIARDEAGLDRAGQLASVARLSPLVAEELAARDRVDLHLGLARAVGAEHVEVHAGSKTVLGDARLGPGCDAGDDVGAEGVVAAAGLPAELAGQCAGRVRIGVEADARAELRGRQAARGPAAVDAAAD